MHPPHVHERVRELAGEGLNDSEIGRRLGLSRWTVREIRAPRYVRREPEHRCPRCWRGTRAMAFTDGDYAELLGFYLGDGDVSQVGRTHRLRLSLDAAYPALVEHARRLLENFFLGNEVGVLRRHEGWMVVLSVHSSHLACLFPQHGPGKKHERRILLEDWQADCLAAAPYAFLRGLLWTDGCFFINRTGRYAYLSVIFDNFSEDIRGLFRDACDHVGVRYVNSRRSVRIYRRESVALLAAFVGSKR